MDLSSNDPKSDNSKSLKASGEPWNPGELTTPFSGIASLGIFDGTLIGEEYDVELDNDSLFTLSDDSFWDDPCPPS